MSIVAATPLEVDRVSKTFRIHHERPNSLKERLAGRRRNRYEEFLALRDVSFSVREGEVFGVIGHNGSGKSTLLKCMAGILQPTSGEIRVDKRMSALLELGAGFHPELTGRDNVFLNAAILGMTRREIAERFDEIVEFSGLEQFIDTPVKTYSSGMYVRLAFAVAINVDPQLLLIDEILAVGDVTFQQRCMEKFSEFRDEGRTIVLVTHDLASVRDMCDRGLWLDHGEIRGEGNPSDLVERYHAAMMGGEPTGDGGVRRGSGEVRVESVELLMERTPTSTVRTGDDVTIRLRYHVEQPVERPVFAIEIESVHGVRITAPSSRDVDVVPDRVTSDGTLDISVGSLPLLPGTYQLHTDVTDFHRQHVIDHFHHATRFDVTAGSDHESDGLVTLRPTWRFTT